MIFCSGYSPENRCQDSENDTASCVDIPDLHISGFLDAAVIEYSIWQQSRLGYEELKAEVKKACDVALDDGLDMAQIDEDKDLITS